MREWREFTVSAAVGLFALCLLLPLTAPAQPLLQATNATAFFTNLASRFLKAEMNLDLHHLQVWPTNQYTPAVHRLLQVTANLYDATHSINDAYGPLPTVFRPRFQNTGTEIYIEGYDELVTFDSTEAATVLDLSFTQGVAAVKSNSLIFGIPLVIGARKGLPNFNEFSSESVVQITRKIELRKATLDGSINQTNQMFVIGISNGFGAEFWNAYAATNRRPMEVCFTNRVSFRLTNDFGYDSLPQIGIYGAKSVFTNDSTWPGWNDRSLISPSFVVPMRTNIVIVPDSVYSQNSHSFLSLASGFENTPLAPVPLAFPQWGLTITNRIVAYTRDSITGRLLDYVQLAPLVGHRYISEEISTPAKGGKEFDSLWATNMGDGVHLSGQAGIFNQIQIARGENLQQGNWQNYMISPVVGAAKAFEMAKFRAFFTPDNRATVSADGYTVSAENPNLVAVAPFSPTWKQSVPLVWQANDPLVHYLAEDLKNSRSGAPIRWSPPALFTNTLANLGRLNLCYQPWGNSPSQLPWPDAGIWAIDRSFKDPLVISANYWSFPEFAPLDLSTFARVHRGTPWQSIYLKSAPVNNVADWRLWTGNGSVPDADHTLPQRDWNLVDILLPLMNTNHPQALLSLNHPDTNAWLAALAGINVLTNAASDDDLWNNGLPDLQPLSISSDSPQADWLVENIAQARAQTGGKSFRQMSELLALPPLSIASPYLNPGTFDDAGQNVQISIGISDEAYERLPAQLLPRMRLDSEGTITAQGGSVHLQFSGYDGFPYVIENSTNLVTWQAVSTNVPVNGFLEIQLPAPADNTFYRMRVLP